MCTFVFQPEGVRVVERNSILDIKQYCRLVAHGFTEVHGVDYAAMYVVWDA